MNINPFSHEKQSSVDTLEALRMLVTTTNSGFINLHNEGWKNDPEAINGVVNAIAIQQMATKVVSAAQQPERAPRSTQTTTLQSAETYRLPVYNTPATQAAIAEVPANVPVMSSNELNAEEIRRSVQQAYGNNAVPLQRPFYGDTEGNRDEFAA